MPFSTIDVLPDPPQRGDNPDTFADDADTWVVATQTFSEQLNTFKSELETAAALIDAAPSYSDPGLVALTGNTPAADKFLYYTGASTSAIATVTSFARTLLDDADQATAQATLGVVPGTDVQAYDAGLADVAGLAVTDGNFIVGDGANWVAESGATARTSMGAAASGANSDITSLSALSTALSVAQGGTGASTAAAALANFLTVTDNSNGICIAIPIGATTYMVQWGRKTVSPNTTGTFTFPVAFTNASSVSCVANGVGETGDFGQASKPTTVYAVSTTGATYIHGDEVSCTAFWIAWGV